MKTFNCLKQDLNKTLLNSKCIQTVVYRIFSLGRVLENFGCVVCGVSIKSFGNSIDTLANFEKLIFKIIENIISNFD